MNNDVVFFGVVGMFCAIGVTRLRRAPWRGVLIIALSLTTAFGYGLVKHWTRAIEARHHHTSDLRLLADELNGPLPKMVATGARWDAVTVEPGNVLEFTYTLVATPAAKVDRVAMASQAKQLPAQVCSDPDARDALDGGTTIRFVYRDMNNKPIADFAVRGSDCR